MTALKRDVSEGAEDGSAVSKKRHIEAEETTEERLVEKNVAAENLLTSDKSSKPGAAEEVAVMDAQLQRTNYFYFKQYKDLSVHDLMLRDRPRMEAYVKAIANSSEMEGKVVMDVGSGTGFLALMCATQGKAKHVHAVEANVNTANIIRDLVHQNGLVDRITVWDCTVEALIAEESDRLDITADGLDNLLCKGSVDVIVSEWMGMYLLHESMLESVLVARDHFMFGGETFSDDDKRWAGKNILPRVCELFTAPLDFSRYKAAPEPTYFQDLYGLKGFDRYFGNTKIDPPKPCITTWLTSSGELELGIDPQDLLVTTPAKILTMDLMHTKTIECFHFPKVEFPKIEKAGLFGGVGVWFDCVFTDRNGAEVARLETGPQAPLTHWRQTIVDLGDVFPMEAGTAFTYELKLEQCKENRRFYDISLST